MRQTWRWFGPKDLVSIDDMLQAGVEGVVTALHHVPNGAPWTVEEISKRQSEIEVRGNGTKSGLVWEVVESLPVSEDIKKQNGAWRSHLENYKTSMRNLADAGLQTICYNFMPVLDWTRTDLVWRLPTGATCMRFDYSDFAAFDIHILQRNGASLDYPSATVEQADTSFSRMSDEERDTLTRSIAFGLPGAAEQFTLSDIREHLADYRTVTSNRLRSHLVDFLSEIIPAAEQLGLRMCCHPDDPPFNLLGLPRIMSTEDDYRLILDSVDSPANGITLCTGSLGARPDNDLPGMIDRLGDRIHFLHLRNVKRETVDIKGSFHEAEHLGGDTDMVAVIAAVFRQESRRRSEGRSDNSIPMRPDHGQDILDDQTRRAQPGYPAIGRLKGLAELRGIMTALSRDDLTQLIAE